MTSASYVILYRSPPLALKNLQHGQPLWRTCRISAACALAISSTLFGCSKEEPPVQSAKISEEPSNPWFLVCGDFSDSQPALLWNGLVGLRLGRMGTAAGQGSEVLPMFWCNGYQHDGEEKIVPLPNPFGVTLKINGSSLSRPAAYAQVLDMRNAKLTTRMSGTIAERSRVQYEIQNETVLAPGSAVMAQQWTIRLSAPAEIQISAQCENSNQRLDPVQSGEYCQFKLEDRTIAIQAENSLSWVGKDNRAQRNSNVRSSNALYASERVLSSEVKFERVARIGFHQSLKADVKLPSFEELANKSSAYWNQKWQTDITVDGPPEDQQALRSMLFYLRSSLSPASPMSIAPFGLSHETYSGHIFWDADLWVFPAIALIDPKSAAAISHYRLERQDRNKDKADWVFREWKRRPLPDHPILIYPWQSSVTGKEVAPGDSRKEIHISGDIAWSLELSRALGIVKQNDVLNEIAKTYLALADGETELSLKDVMSPDEFHIGDNDLFTNAIAQWCVDRATQNLGPRAQSKFVLPKDEISLINYENDRLRGYKQAAGVLAIYPLQHPIAESQAEIMMERFSHKTTPNGPSMSESIHATIWARLGDNAKAYESWLLSWRDFMKGPLLLFGEKRRTNATYFTTGAAGCIQTVIYGFLGFRIDDAKNTRKKQFVKLADGRHLTFSPNLPKLWKSVRFTNFTVCGRRYSMTVDHKMAVLTPEGGTARVVWTRAESSAPMAGRAQTTTNPTQEKP